jgi:hypothetical protein
MPARSTLRAPVFLVALLEAKLIQGINQEDSGHCKYCGATL